MGWAALGFHLITTLAPNYKNKQDTIKTRMQLNPALYPGIVSTGSTIARQEGVRALWKGLTPFATHLCLKYALRFGTNAGFQSLLADEHGKLNDTRRVLAGLGAGVTEALVIVTPFEVRCGRGWMDEVRDGVIATRTWQTHPAIPTPL